jgi:ubiquinone/menaquinone biosynthesis C-methylase UbiE
MERDWDQRAREEARFYITPDNWESEEVFRESGEREVRDYVLGGITLSPDSRVLEIGCGIGRLMQPMATRFADVTGVDISAEMVAQGSERLKDLSNVHFQQTDGSLAFPDASFDFCYSWRVFLHVPRKEYVLRYFEEVSRVLKPGGLFRFDVAKDEGEGARRDQAGTWFGVVFSEEELRKALEASGLEPLEIRHEGRRGLRVLWENWIVTARRQRQPASN